MKFAKYNFLGGIHPAYDGKYLTKDSPIRTAPLLERYTVPLAQSIGAPPELLVAVGDHVLKGQKIATAKGFVSANLHSPVSGTVSAITEIPGATGRPVTSIVIDSDGKDESAPLLPALDWHVASVDELKARIQEAGIVGMGGAAFPTAVKLSPPPDHPIDLLILNGAECEPYLSADHRLMLEEPDLVLAGAAIMAKILNVQKIRIGVEANKINAIDALQAKAALYGALVVPMKVRYPQGSEKQLIYAISGRKVPTGKLPMDAKCVVQNVGTAAAVAEAVLKGKPLYERIVSITGEVVRKPCNLRLRIGTTAEQAIALAGGLSAPAAKLIFGGPMMGFSLKSSAVSVQKNTSGILLLSQERAPQFESQPCIRCGRCANVCPMHLQPSQLATSVESEKFDLAYQNHIMDCIECGSCAYECPAHRPLVQHMRRGKTEIRNWIARQKAASK